CAGLTIVGCRRADCLQLLILAVVLPPINLPILVAVDLDANEAGPVHECHGVDAAVFVSVVEELCEPTAVVVLRLDGAVGGRVVNPATSSRERDGHAKSEKEPKHFRHCWCPITPTVEYRNRSNVHAGRMRRAPSGRR